MNNFYKDQPVRILRPAELAFKYWKDIPVPVTSATVLDPQARFYGRQNMVRITMPDGYEQLVDERNLEATE